MSNLVVNVAVIRDCKILMTQREDFETWILPSGGVEDGESIAQAAIRETKEETGLDVELTRLVGIYSRLGTLPDIHAVLFVAKPFGGEIKCQEGETIAVEWFPFDDLPSPLSVGHEKRINDAIKDVGGGISVLQDIQLQKSPEFFHRKELYKLRNKSGLSRQDYYLQLVEGISYDEEVEVGDV